jgi:hypothetical protein
MLIRPSERKVGGIVHVERNTISFRAETHHGKTRSRVRTTKQTKGIRTDHRSRII